MNPLVPKALTSNCLNVASVLPSLDPCLPLAKGTAVAQLNPVSPSGDGLNIPSVWAITLATNLPLSLSLSIYLDLCTHITR